MFFFAPEPATKKMEPNKNLTAGGICFNARDRELKLAKESKQVEVHHKNRKLHGKIRPLKIDR